MKAMIVCGSRDGGFTSEMCRSFSKGLETDGISSEIIFPIGMDIKHCTGCGDCSAGGECSISDDMDAIYSSFGESDLLVLAAPIHFSGPSSAIKTVIDRFQPLWFKKREHPAFAVALLSGGGPSPRFANAVSVFRAFSLTAGMKWLGQLEIADTDEKEIKAVAGPPFEYGEYIGLFLLSNL
jgi:multimeric flavodoxin WrbA